MENTLRTQNESELIQLFDLKGSSVDRESAPDAGTLKDTNFQNLKYKSDLYDIQQNQAKERYHQLEIDVNFLKNCGLMDYSLLIGIERT